MNIKFEIVALAIRILANETNVIAKPSQLDILMADMFGFESYDRQMARKILEKSAEAKKATERLTTNRKFKKIVKKF